MRLQLTAAVVAVAAGAAAARAEPPPAEASATLRVYADDDRVTVLSPAAHVATGAGPLGLELDLTIDAISAASVDVITAASPTAIEERRVEADLGLRLALGPTVTARTGVAVSHEDDYDALRAALGLAVELAARNTTLELRVRAGRDHATDVTDPTFAADRTSVAAIATLTQVLDARTVADLTAELTHADGWHASPYRRIATAMTTGPQVAWVREATPAIRDSVAAALRVRRALAARWFTTATLRGYVDDWDVASATATLEVRQARPTGTLLGLTGRGYAQRAADFWARRYDPDAVPTWRTADRTLGPMASAMLEAVVDQPLGADGPRLLVAAGAIALFFDAPSQRRRLGLTMTVALTVPL